MSSPPRTSVFLRNIPGYQGSNKLQQFKRASNILLSELEQFFLEGGDNTAGHSLMCFKTYFQFGWWVRSAGISGHRLTSPQQVKGVAEHRLQSDEGCEQLDVGEVNKHHCVQRLHSFLNVAQIQCSYAFPRQQMLILGRHVDDTVRKDDEIGHREQKYLSPLVSPALGRPLLDPDKFDGPPNCRDCSDRLDPCCHAGPKQPAIRKCSSQEEAHEKQRSDNGRTPDAWTLHMVAPRNPVDWIASRQFRCNSSSVRL